MQSKKCLKCGEIKPLTREFFQKQEQNKDGFRYECKKCSNIIAKRKREKYKDTDRDYYKSKRFVYSQLKYQAKKRKYKFDIDYEYYEKELTDKPCCYCGSIDTKHWIDRYDNDKGYTKKNSVPCCEMCNKTKMKFNANDWINHCKKVADYNK
jgi:hypothetical protein